MATVSAEGAPYIQHRGGPKGFIKVLDDKTLGFADYAGNDKALYEKSIGDTKSMFNSDGKMPSAGAANVLNVLSQFSPNVKGKKDSVRLAETYTTEFVDQASA